VRSLLSRVVATCRRRRLDRELRQEIAVHLEMAAFDLEAQGMDPEAARRAALRDFGDVAQAVEADREARGFAALERWRSP
jgi:hypothetical protein